MKLLDLILIGLAALALMLSGYDVSAYLFKHANDWIPGVFSDAVQWHPGATFHWSLSAIVAGLLLVRFAAYPVGVALVVGLIIALSNLYPLMQANGLWSTLKFSARDITSLLKNYQLVGLFPMITQLIYWLKKPSREHEVYDHDLD